MQGKGLIKVFLVLIIAVCLAQFLYYIPTNRAESAADQHALKLSGNNEAARSSAAFKINRARYLDSISDLELFRIPLVKSYTYSELKKSQLALGLDLKGGMSALLKVDLADFVKGLAGRNANNADFQKAVDSALKLSSTSQSDFITLFTQEYRKTAGEGKLARLFAKSEALGEIANNATDGVVTQLLRRKADETVKTTFEQLKKRIDKLGVAQPNISLDASRDIIVVEMPGIDNPARARQFLSQSARLEFWEVFRNVDPGIVAAFDAADALTRGEAVAGATRDSFVYDNLGNITDTIKVAGTAGGAKGALLTALAVNAIPQASPVIGTASKSQKVKIDEILSRPEVKSLFPANGQFMWSYKSSLDENGKASNNYELYLIKKQPNSETALLDGDVITSAAQTLDPLSGQVQVVVRKNAQGAKKWAEMTTKAANDGNNSIAITLDGEVVSAPSVNEPITQGTSQISGNFSVEEAKDFASILEVGKLPARTTIISETNVGPSLGKENISKSINSILIGFGLVLITMLAYYAGGGLIAVLILFLNIFLIFGSLSSFGTVLTLSGIAGIVLTIGMAVDANVIIFERIKEELNVGKNLRTAVADGFYHSYSAIIDANVTTLLTAMVLAYFGLGPVKGFAVVLIIGVLSSVFTAVLVSKIVFDWWLGKGKEISFWNGFSKNAFQNLNIDWIGKRKIAYIISGAVILLGIGSMFVRGFDLGVDFRGGYTYNVQFTGTEGINTEKLTTSLASTFGANPVVKQVDTDNNFQITTSYLINDLSEDAPTKVMDKLYEGIKSATGSSVTLEDFANPETGNDKIHVTSFAKVTPTVSDDLKSSSILAGVLALLAIFLYIFLRFNKWQYSAGAIIALFHDALLVLASFSLLWGLLPISLEIDQAFIAAILTVIGYSINDTVIIFDRIREYIGLHVHKSNDEIINDAINSTMPRTIMTSGTTLVVILALLLFGGASIKGFAFALFVGVLVGTYSSIFIAAPILHDLAADLKVKATSFSDKKEEKVKAKV